MKGGGRIIASRKEVNPVHLALQEAGIFLSAIYGILLDIEDKPYYAELDLKVHKLIDEAIEWLNKQSNENNYHKF